MNHSSSVYFQSPSSTFNFLPRNNNRDQRYNHCLHRSFTHNQLLNSTNITDMASNSTSTGPASAANPRQAAGVRRSARLAASVIPPAHDLYLPAAALEYPESAASTPNPAPSAAAPPNIMNPSIAGPTMAAATTSSAGNQDGSNGSLPCVECFKVMAVDPQLRCTHNGSSCGYAKKDVKKCTYCGDPRNRMCVSVPPQLRLQALEVHQLFKQVPDTWNIKSSTLSYLRPQHLGKSKSASKFLFQNDIPIQYQNFFAEWYPLYKALPDDRKRAKDMRAGLP